MCFAVTRQINGRVLIWSHCSCFSFFSVVYFLNFNLLYFSELMSFHIATVTSFKIHVVKFVTVLWILFNSDLCKFPLGLQNNPITRTYNKHITEIYWPPPRNWHLFKLRLSAVLQVIQHWWCSTAVPFINDNHISTLILALCNKNYFYVKNSPFPLIISHFWFMIIRIMRCKNVIILLLDE